MLLKAILICFLIHVLSLLICITRKDLAVSQRELEEVKNRLRLKEKQAEDALKADGAPRVAGLCLKCAQHDAVLAGTHANLHVQAIDRLTKLVVTNTHLPYFYLAEFLFMSSL